MTLEVTTRSNQTARRKRQTRHKKKSFTDRTYGARLPYEDARVLDDYAERNKLDGADVVRLAVKQFVVRQNMKYQPKDTVRAAVEEVVSEHLAPVIALLEKHLSHNHPADQINSPLREQKQLLERVLLASTLAMRLIVNYSVEPDLRAADALNADQIKAHLLAADNGRDAWCALTKQVIKRTGQRVRHDLNLRSPDAAPPPQYASEEPSVTDAEHALTEMELAEVLS